MLLDDLAARLVAQGVGTLGTDIFLSTAAVVPKLAGATLTVVETGGGPAEHTQNSTDAPAWRRPSAQVMARGATYALARAKAEAAYAALAMVRNTMINGNRYREISAVQEPFDLGRDEQGFKVVFNVNVIVNERTW